MIGQHRLSFRDVVLTSLEVSRPTLPAADAGVIAWRLLVRLVLTLAVVLLVLLPLAYCFGRQPLGPERGLHDHLAGGRP